MSRIFEGVTTNLVTAAALWLIAIASGLAAGHPEVTAAALVVLVAAVSTAAAAWVTRSRARMWRVRAATNWLNLSTPLGLALGRWSADGA